MDEAISSVWMSVMPAERALAHCADDGPEAVIQFICRMT
jgi:hypothetical protein